MCRAETQPYAGPGKFSGSPLDPSRACVLECGGGDTAFPQCGPSRPRLEQRLRLSRQLKAPFKGGIFVARTSASLCHAWTSAPPRVIRPKKQPPFVKPRACPPKPSGRRRNSAKLIYGSPSTCANDVSSAIRSSHPIFAHLRTPTRTPPAGGCTVPIRIHPLASAQPNQAAHPAARRGYSRQEYSTQFIGFLGKKRF